jgi:hypothetical protein
MMKSLYLSICAISEVLCVVLIRRPGYEFEVGIAFLMVVASFLTALLVDMLEDMATTPRTAHRREVRRWAKREWHSYGFSHQTRQ